MRWLKAWMVMALLAGAPAIAYAQTPHTATDVNLRAGPSIDYPVVAIIVALTPISIVGCLDDFRWCDVVAGGYRGWVYAKNIYYPYQGANVSVLTYGHLLGFGILAFNVGRYWDDHYRGRPWYPERQGWIDRSPPRFGGYGRRPPPGAPSFQQGEHRYRPPVVRPGEQRPPPQAVRPGERRPPAQAVRPGEHRPPAQGPGMGPRSPDRRSQSGGRPPRSDRD